MSMFDALNNQGYSAPSQFGFNTGASGGFNLGNAGYNPANSGLVSQQQSPYSFSGLDTSGAMSGLQMGQLGLGALSGIANSYLGFQNAKLAKSQAAQAQSNWNKQWDANVQTTNASLEDRQKARVASNPNAYESVDSYMKKYGIS